MRKYFGTDGVRGIANYDLTPALAFSVGRAGGYVLKKHSNKTEGFKVIIGTDTRISKDLLQNAIGAGMMSIGFDVLNVGVCPTPAVAYLTRKHHYDAGIVISASHNPSEYNGIKFFNSDGFKLADEIEEEIEYYMENPEEISSPYSYVGTDLSCFNLIDEYADYLVSCAPKNLDGINITLDCANGAAYRIAPYVFKKLGANVKVIFDTPDGKNINLSCGSTHLENLSRAVKTNHSDIGLAYDGDADRLLAVDENGNGVSGDQMLMLFAKNLKDIGKLKNNTLVVTVMSNLGLKFAAEKHGIDIATTNVGDRYVLENMLKNDYVIGGEQSGHMIFLEHNTTGDGILSSIMLSSVLKNSGKKMSELAAIVEILPQILINAHVDNNRKNEYKTDDEIQKRITSIENHLSNSGRVLIRPSGTEPLVRVMIEGRDMEGITELAKELASLIEKKLS